MLNKEILIGIYDSISLGISFSPDQIAGLRSWYDFSYGVYRTNSNDATDDQYAGANFNGTVAIGTPGVFTIFPNFSLFNDKNGYGPDGDGNFLRWENNVWTLTYVSNKDEDVGNYYTIITASGNTQYPWQANWSGSGNNVTRVATTNSVLATNNQTVAKWRNKVENLGNRFGGHMVQDTLASQPTLTTGGIVLNAKRMQAIFGTAPTAQRTYYMVGNGFSQSSGFNNTILASSSSTINSTFRNALISRNVNENKYYGLSQGTATSSSFAPVSDGSSQIICVSFESAGSGKIKVNNQTEETLTGIGTNFSSTSVSLFLGSTAGSSDLTAKEILFFEGAHTTEQKTQVINYLNAKHNVF